VWRATRGGFSGWPCLRLARARRTALNYELAAEAEGGMAVTQAGSHPYQITGTIDFNQGWMGSPPTPSPVLARDVVTRLPVGLIANITPFARC
jgi:hypothetical protein